MRVISVTVSESIWRIVDVTKYTGNQVIAAIQRLRISTRRPEQRTDCIYAHVSLSITCLPHGRD